jgi:hypothetical protein
LSHLYVKTNILPRQARDKHREIQNGPFFLRLNNVNATPTTNVTSAAHRELAWCGILLFGTFLCYAKNDQFTKTGSGETWKSY